MARRSRVGSRVIIEASFGWHVSAGAAGAAASRAIVGVDPLAAPAAGPSAGAGCQRPGRRPPAPSAGVRAAPPTAWRRRSPRRRAAWSASARRRTSASPAAPPTAVRGTSPTAWPRCRRRGTSASGSSGRRCPAARTARSRATASALGDCQVSSAIGRLNSVTDSACQTTMTPAVSVRVSTLVMRKDDREDRRRGQHQQVVAARRCRRAQPSRGPTTISTPAKPSAVASQRSQRIGSRRNSQAPTMMNSGVVKPRPWCRPAGCAAAPGTTAPGPACARRRA